MSHLLEAASCAEADRSFGPSVLAACRAFDFTLLFEQIFLSLIPAVALVISASFRLWKLRHAQAAAAGVLLQACKQVSRDFEGSISRRRRLTDIVFYKFAILGYVVTQVAALILWSSSTHKTDVSVASAVFSLLASLLVSPLSYTEGKACVRPSVVLDVYLLGSSLFDAVIVRTLWLAGLQNLAIVSSVGLGTKVLLLFVEAQPKKALAKDGTTISREERAGVYSLRTFWWINEILWLGRRQFLKLTNLYSIDPGLKTARYSVQLAHNWDRSDSGKKYSLVLAVFSTLKWPLLAPAIPRAILIG